MSQIAAIDLNDNASRNRRVLLSCVGLVCAMIGLAYASVPLYDLFCRVTGYGGTTQRVETSNGIAVIDRAMTVRFDANIASGLNWKFQPEQRSVDVKLGQKMQINYVAENLSDKTLHGTATFNVTPQSAGAYFNKIECFCFTETSIAPGEKLIMPVVFFVDPEMDVERELKAVKTLTLSYTFFEDKKVSGDAPQAETQAKLELKAGDLPLEKL